MLTNSRRGFAPALGFGLQGGAQGYNGQLEQQQSNALKAMQAQAYGVDVQAKEAALAKQKSIEDAYKSFYGISTSTPRGAPGSLDGATQGAADMPMINSPQAQQVNTTLPQQSPPARNNPEQEAAKDPGYQLQLQTAAAEGTKPMTAVDYLIATRPNDETLWGKPQYASGQSSDAGNNVPRRASAANDSYTRHLQFAQHLERQGLPAEAQKYYTLAEKFKPKIKEQKNLRDAQGNVVTVNVFDDGSTEVVEGFSPAEKLHFSNTGGATLGMDQYTGKPVATIKNSQSPDSAASNATTRRGQDLKYAADTQANSIIGGKQAFEAENKLGDDHKAQSKTFIDVRDATTRINASLQHATKSAAATLAGATSFMKLLDPGSVVRESELGMALQATGVLDRASNYYKTLQMGKVLTESQAKDFQNIADQVYKAAEQNQIRLDAQYADRAKNYGLNASNVVGNYYIKPSARPDGQAKNLLSELPTANTSNKGKILIDHETGKRLRSNGMQWQEVK